MSENNHSSDRAKKDDQARREKYLIFSLVDEKYGIPLLLVKEIIGSVDIRPVPQVPDFFKGFINLRGEVISVIDLRKKLKLKVTEGENKKTSIIIFEIQNVRMGAIVDNVDEVLGFEQGQIDTSLELKATVQKDFIVGVAKTSTQRLILLLDIRKILTGEELKMVQQKAS